MRSSIERPLSVKLATAFLSAGLALNVLRTLYFHLVYANPRWAASFLGGWIWAALYYQIWCGRAWARLLLLIAIPAGFYAALRLHRIHSILDVIPLSLAIAAVILLFSTASNRWFRHRRPATPPVQGMPSVKT
jgi:hypothetical protein